MSTNNLFNLLNNYSTLFAEDYTDSTRVSNLVSYLESPFLRAVATVFADNVIGEGLRLQSTPDWEILKIPEDEAHRWARDVEVRYRKWEHQQRWASKQYLLYKNYKVFGGALLFFLSNSERRLKVIVKDTQVIDVEKNDYVRGHYKGLVLNKFFEVEGLFLRSSPEYKVAEDYLRRLYVRGKQTFLFYSPPDLAGQVQSQGLFNKLNAYSKQATDFINFQVETARVQAAITAIVVTNSLGKGNEVFGGKNSKRIIDPDGTESVKVKPGTVMKIQQGESVNLSDVNRTVPNIKDFLSSIAQIVGSFVGLPPSVILRSFDKSYSASRAEIQESWKRFMVERAHFVSNVQTPVYEQWLRKEVLEGRIRADGYLDDEERRQAYNRAGWLGLSQPSIDPVKDAKAAFEHLKMGIVSRETLSYKAGYNYEDEMIKKALEMAPEDTSNNASDGDDYDEENEEE